MLPNHLTLMNICKVKSNQMWGEKKKKAQADIMLNCFISLFLSLFGSLAKLMPSRHLSLSRGLHQSLISVSWVELKRSFCSKCGLAWLFLRKGALMSAMLMRNYQKLIKIKKGPKVKDLLITVPCKACIIRSRESEPNTAETAVQDCTVHANPFSPYIQ